MQGRRLVRRTLTVLVIGLVVLEAALQIASLLAPLIDRTEKTAAAANTVRILVVGDSHAAGAGAPGKGLSEHLGSMLTARHPGRVFEIVNLGRAGVNSAYVANRLEANLLAYRPQLVIVWVGVNDLWNVLETESWAGGDARLRLRRLLLHSKVYRLATVLLHTWRRDVTAAPHRLPFQGAELVPVARGLAFDVERMVRTAFALRAPVLLYRYVAESTVPHVEMLLRQAGHAICGTPQTPPARDREPGPEAEEITDRRPLPSGSSP